MNSKHATGDIQKANRRKYITEALKRGEALEAEGSQIESLKNSSQTGNLFKHQTKNWSSKKSHEDDRTDIIATNIVLD